MTKQLSFPEYMSTLRVTYFSAMYNPIGPKWLSIVLDTHQCNTIALRTLEKEFSPEMTILETDEEKFDSYSYLGYPPTTVQIRMLLPKIPTNLNLKDISLS